MSPVLEKLTILPKIHLGKVKMNFKNLSLAALLITALTGCAKTVALKDYNGNQFAQLTNKLHTAEQTEKYIKRACAQLGWNCVSADANTIRGELMIRTHTLVVDIEYNNEQFSIKYVDSTNLKYDGKYIHRQYENWVLNLIRHINKESITE